MKSVQNMKALYRNEYGYFDGERREYVITRADTPKPWINVISNGVWGMTVSQAGSGYSWRDHAQFNRITRWDQDLTRDNWGKYIYIRDEQTGELWSPTPRPAGAGLTNYSCRHGLGYTVFSGERRGVQSELLVFVDPDAPVEVWALSLRNTDRKPRALSLFTYLEWCLGTAPDWHREFEKIFITTEFEKKTGIFWAQKTRWGLPDPSGRPWARPYEFVGFHTSLPAPIGFDSDQRAVVGVLGDLQRPHAFAKGRLTQHQGRNNDGVAALQSRITLRPGESRSVVFLLGATRTRAEARKIVARFRRPGAVVAAHEKMRNQWIKRLDALQVETPDESVNLLVNQWLPYQAISCRMWGRTAYYQTGGAYGYRDQLQDSLASLALEPSLCREHLERAARHQFSDGTTFHWWHPITEDGAKKKNSDDLLWLPFVLARYVKETGDLAFLKTVVPFFDKGAASMREHARAAIEQVLARPSPRGIPTMIEGDWNDGLSCIGFDKPAESVWLGEFLYGVLTEWCEVLEAVGDEAARKDRQRYWREAARLKEAINRHAWDGRWYIRATYAKGVLGSKRCRVGKIWLNSQTWALMYGIAPEQRRQAILKALDQYLYRDYGPLLFYPAFEVPDPAIGHLSQYAPGLRENGGLYTHAGCWAIIAEALAGTPDRAYRVFSSFNPVLRGQKPDYYCAEPYVTPGNVDGPQSPNYGRGGWTWYTGSAAWMYRALTDYIMGVRPTMRGLVVDPAIPGAWKEFSMTRKFRGATYEIVVRNRRSSGSAKGRVRITVNDEPLRGNVLPIVPAGSRVIVEAVVEDDA
jgi:cellobiose phosphorylase